MENYKTQYSEKSKCLVGHGDERKNQPRNCDTYTSHIHKLHFNEQILQLILLWTVYWPNETLINGHTLETSANCFP